VNTAIPVNMNTINSPHRSKADEPFAVDLLGHLLQQRDAPLVVLD
jgi:hypothetical protein